MKLISWNVNGIRAVVKKGYWGYLEESGADIFCIQETKAEANQLPVSVREPAGWFSTFDHSRGKKGYSGTAIYSRIKPVKITYGLGTEEMDQEGRLISAFYDDFALINCYFPNGGMGLHRLEFKLRYYDAFLAYVNELAKKHSVIFCGDVNTAHFPIDLARPKENEKNTGFLPVERAWLDKVVDQGWIDTYRHFHPDQAGAYTYWDMKTGARARNIGWRIDYFFVHKSVLPRVRSSEIAPQIYGSDHCPILLDLK